MNIQTLDLKIIEMCKKVKESLEYAFSFYLKNNTTRDESIIDDSKIDELEREIEEICLTNILKERPFATDLRKITGYFKVSEDLERLGDHAEDIEWCNKILETINEEHHLKVLDKMVNKALIMMNDSISSLLNEDEELAKKVIESDDEIDKLYLEFLSTLPFYKSKYNETDDKFLIYYTLIAKYVERIADHSSNIAEWAIYIKSGYYKDRNII